MALLSLLRSIGFSISHFGHTIWFSHLQKKIKYRRKLKGGSIYIGHKHQVEWPKYWVSKRLKVGTILEQSHGTKQKFKDTDRVSMDRTGMQMGNKMLKKGYMDLKTVAVLYSLQKKGAWKTSPIRPPVEG
ncbi:uncharacterized protein G2W53_021858 [Senna tora]|uniref:Uncharacterized protein n=1 Tax=Senna tora TaxID=362788 RepID=A0A834WNR6_9FABA|nr:uncharacterized protein G2W53_021858 [Senna tora]